MGFKKTEQIEIKAPNLQVATFTIKGDAPFVQHRFTDKAKTQMRETQEAGSVAKKGKKREAKNFQEACESATYRGAKGEYGIPATAFRAAMISACRMVGFAMTKAKMSVFIQADTFDKIDSTPLVKFTSGSPKMSVLPARNSNGGMDLRSRPMWNPGWTANVTVKFDADQFSLMDVANLLSRAGLQVGVGEGRPDSKQSTGCGWGTFSVLSEKQARGKGRAK